MASKEYVQERINNVTARIEKTRAIIAKKTKWIEQKKAKLEDTLDRDERYWLECDISSLEMDIKSKEKDLQRDLLPALEKWNQELIKIQQTKRDIPVLVEFLNKWRERVEEFYRQERTSDARTEMKKAWHEASAAYTDLYNNWHKHPELKDKSWQEIRKALYELEKPLDAAKEAYYDRFGLIETWEHTEGGFEAAMAKTLQREWEHKYDRLVADVTREVGTIVDCTGLHVSGRGELNGIVIGENGKASVNTFLAGGYAVQVLHYRCRITKMK